MGVFEYLYKTYFAVQVLSYYDIMHDVSTVFTFLVEIKIVLFCIIKKTSITLSIESAVDIYVYFKI